MWGDGPGEGLTHVAVRVFCMIYKIVSFSHSFSPHIFVEHLHMTCSLQSKMGLVLAPQSLHSAGQVHHKQVCQCVRGNPERATERNSCGSWEPITGTLQCGEGGGWGSGELRPDTR